MRIFLNIYEMPSRVKSPINVKNFLLFGAKINEIFYGYFFFLKKFVVFQQLKGVSMVIRYVQPF